MHKIKRLSLILAYLLMLIISLPFIVLWLVSGAIIYGTLKVECALVCGIWEEDLTESWNRMWQEFGEMIDHVKSLFLMEMEL